jgi:hypothetical protein
MDDQHILPFDIWTVILDYWWIAPVRSYSTLSHPIAIGRMMYPLIIDLSSTAIALYDQNFFGCIDYTSSDGITLQWFVCDDGSYIVAHDSGFGDASVETGLDFLASMRLLQKKIATCVSAMWIAEDCLVATQESCIMNL